MSAHELLVRFLTTLRASGVRISVAEELDAMLVAEVVGYQDRSLLRDALGLTVAKSVEEEGNLSGFVSMTSSTAKSSRNACRRS